MEYKDKHENITGELRELDAQFLLKLHDHKDRTIPSPSYVSELYNTVSSNRHAAIVPLWRRPRAWAATGILLLAISSIYLIGSNKELTLDQISEADVYAYIMDLEDIGSDDLLYTNDITDTGLEILDQSILDYLDDHIEDIDIIELNSY